MKERKHIDKTRLTFFTDALLAIIMTILVLDIKVPEGLDKMTGDECFVNLLKVYPHFLGFIISFAFIIVLWFSHHELMESLIYANRTFAVINFCFVGATATLPFSTALAAAYPYQSYAVATLALNMFVMNVFLTGLHTYSIVSGLRNMDYFPPRYLRFKRIIGLGGTFISLVAIFVSFYSPSFALILIAAVPVMHNIPVKW